MPNGNGNNIPSYPPQVVYPPNPWMSQQPSPLGNYPPWWTTMEKDPWYATAGKAILGEQQFSEMQKGYIEPWVNLGLAAMFMGRGEPGGFPEVLPGMRPRVPVLGPEELQMPPATKALFDQVKAYQPPPQPHDPGNLPSMPASDMAKGGFWLNDQRYAVPFDYEGLPYAPKPGSPEHFYDSDMPPHLQHFIDQGVPVPPPYAGPGIPGAPPSPGGGNVKLPRGTYASPFDPLNMILAPRPLKPGELPSPQWYEDMKTVMDHLHDQMARTDKLMEGLPGQPPPGNPPITPAKPQLPPGADPADYSHGFTDPETGQPVPNSEGMSEEEAKGVFDPKSPHYDPDFNAWFQKTYGPQPPQLPPSKPALPIDPLNESPAAELERILYWGGYQPGGKPYYPTTPANAALLKQLGTAPPPNPVDSFNRPPPYQTTPPNIRQPGDLIQSPYGGQRNWNEILSDWLHYIKNMPAGDQHQVPGGLDFKPPSTPIYKTYDYSVPFDMPQPPARFTPFIKPPPPEPPQPPLDFSQFGYVDPRPTYPMMVNYPAYA